MKLSIAIINYNDATNTINFINTIKDYNLISNIVVVDNASTDDSLKILNELNIPKIKIIANPVNSGYGEGINICARYLLNNRIDGVMCVCNTDIVINEENDLQKMLDCFDHDTAVVAPIIDENDTMRYGFKLCSVREELLLSLPFLYQKFERKFRFYSEYTKVVDCIMGCMFMIKLDVLKKINYFDNNMFLYYEENVLGIKLKDYGMKSLVCESVIVKHNHSKTIDKSIKRINKYKILKQSQRYYLKKYLHASWLSLLIFDIIKTLFVIALNIKAILKKEG